MASDPPPRTDPVELDAVEDKDFGRMRLMRQMFRAKSPGDKDWSEHHIVYWEGTLAGAPFNIYVEEAGPFPDMSDETRAVLLRIGATEPALRRDVASRLLDLAKDWADSGDLPVPTLASFEAGLRLDAVQTYEDWRPTLYFEERETDVDRTIFAGHVIEVRLDADGSIMEAHIAG
jgi:hypothetical protein